MAKHQRPIFLILFLLPCFFIRAQTPTKMESEYERYVRQQQASFNRFAERRQQEMDSLRQAANKAFNAMLNKDWKEAESKKISSPYPRPKPVEPPRAEKKEQRDTLLLEQTKKQKESGLAPNKNREKDNRLSAEEPKPKKDAPVSAEPALDDFPEPKPEPRQNEERLDELSAFPELGLEKVQTFGWDWYMPSVTPGFEAPQGPINDKTIAAAYAKWIGSNQEQLLGYFKASQKKFNLNDWALLLLIRKLSAKLGYNPAQAAVFEWFYLTQLGYDAILMYSDREVYAGLCFAEKVYGRFLEKDGKRYLMPEDAPAKPYYTYQNQNSYATRPIEFKNLGAVQVNSGGKERLFSFQVLGNAYKLPLSYNLGRVQLYASLPQSDIPFYLSNRAAEPWLSEANHQKIARELSRFSKPMDKLRFLHALVLQGIPYQTDQEQFGKEKFCLTEETLDYPFADCEDRSFLLNRLIQTFTTWKTIGVRFPNHLALAVALEPEPGMEVLKHKGRQWVYCDPTYFGADVGRIPVQYKTVAWQAVE